MPIKPKKLYRLYVDESGDHRYGKKNTLFTTMQFQGRTIRIPREDYIELEDNQKRYLSLTACIIEKEFYERTFCIEMEELKKKHFNYDPDEPFIFHREDIVNKRGAFFR